MENLTGLARAWRTAADDLGVEVVVPYELGAGLEYVALVRNFGSANGTLILEEWDDRLCAAAVKHGFGLSCMDSRFYPTYDRHSFIEALIDWTWMGDPDKKPEWCIEIDEDGEPI